MGWNLQLMDKEQVNAWAESYKIQTHERFKRMLFSRTREIKLKNNKQHSFEPFMYIYMFESCFRMLAVILASDFFNL